MKKYLLIFCYCLATQLVSAQTNTEDLEAVIVTGQRIKESYERQNRSIEIISKEEIRTLPVKSTTELLSYLAGVDIRQRGPSGAQADVSIDGSSFDQVLVLVNGVKMSDPQTGHHMLNLPIPLAAIERIEVVRGPAARTYGLNALAGAINIITSIPTDNLVFAQAYTGSSFQKDTATNQSYVNHGVQAAVGIQGPKQGHLLSVSRDEGNGYRYNTDLLIHRVFYQNSFKFDKQHTLEMQGGYINNQFGANAFYAAPNDKEATESVQTAFGHISHTFSPTGKLTLQSGLGYRYNHDDYIYVRQDPSIYRNIHETNVFTGDVQMSLRLKKGTLGAGLELRSEKIKSSNLGKRNRENLGLFAEYKHHFNDRLNLGAGLYANKNSDYDLEVFPGIDASYALTTKWKVFANAGSGQRLPTYTDLYYVGPANEGNPALRPEYAYWTEAGTRFKSESISVSGNWFYRRATDFIDWVRNNESTPWQPRNYQTIHTQGISLSSAFNLLSAFDLPLDKAVLNLNYTWLQPSIELPANDESKYVVDALRHQLNIRLSTRFLDRWGFQLNSRYLKRINSNDYTLLDSRLSYSWKRFSLYFDVNNILNTQYRELAAIPLPGRWYTLGIQFNTKWNPENN